MKNKTKQNKNNSLKLWYIPYLWNIFYFLSFSIISTFYQKTIMSSSSSFQYGGSQSFEFDATDPSTGKMNIQLERISEEQALAPVAPSEACVESHHGFRDGYMGIIVNIVCMTDENSYSSSHDKFRTYFYMIIMNIDVVVVQLFCDICITVTSFYRLWWFFLSSRLYNAQNSSTRTHSNIPILSSPLFLLCVHFPFLFRTLLECCISYLLLYIVVPWIVE